MKIVHVAQQQLARVLIARRVYRLGKVDNHRTVTTHQHVKIRQVTVHHASGQHADHFRQQVVEHLDGGLAIETHVAKPRSRFTVRVRHQLHDQHAVHEVVRNRHAHSGGTQAVDHVDLRRAPGRLILSATMGRALGHGALVTCIAYVATLRVLGALLEASVLRFFIDLRHPQLATAAHQVHLGFLSTHQGAKDLVDEAFVNEGQERIGGAHGGAGSNGWRAAIDVKSINGGCLLTSPWRPRQRPSSWCGFQGVLHSNGDVTRLRSVLASSLRSGVDRG